MAHVSATIPWLEGKDEDFRDLREGLEKMKAGEVIKSCSESSSDSDDEDKNIIKQYQRYEDSDSQDQDEEDEDPGVSNPGKRILWAAQHNKLSIVKSLLATNPKLVSTTDADLYTPLHRAAYGDHLQMVRLLLAEGADPLATTESGWTAFHSAARWDCVSCVEYLLHQTPINLATHGGNTALHIASQHGNRNTVEFLLACSDVKSNLRNSQGDTAKDIAVRMGPLGQLFDAVEPGGVMTYK